MAASAAHRFLHRKDLVPDELLKLPIAVRHEIVTLAQREADGERVTPRWHVVSKALHGQRQHLAPAAEHLRTYQRKLGDSHLLEGADHRTLEWMTHCINAKMTPDQVFQELIEDAVTDVKAVQLLLAREVSPNAVYRNGWTPLHVAALKGHAKLAELLIEHGADVNAQCDALFTPLHYACLAGNEEVAILLRQCDTDVTLKNRSGHTAFQCAASTGHKQLAVKLDRKIGVRQEALLRAKRFYIKLIEGDEGHCVPYEDERSEEFRRGRLLAAVLLVKPRWLKGTREKRQLIPADLLDMPRLGKKVFKKKWEIKVEMFNYRHPKLMPAVARTIFKGTVTAVKLGLLLAEGQKRYDDLIMKREADRLERLRRKEVGNFITWLRHPGEAHREAIMNVVYQETKRKWPITVTAIQDIMERETPLMIQEWDTMYKDDKVVMERLKEFWVENGRRIIGEDPDSDDAYTPRSEDDSATGTSVATETTATTKTKPPLYRRLLNKLRRKADDDSDDDGTATTASAIMM